MEERKCSSPEKSMTYTSRGQVRGSGGGGAAVQLDGRYTMKADGTICMHEQHDAVIRFASCYIPAPTFSTLKSGGTKAGSPTLHHSGCSGFQAAGLHTDCSHCHKFIIKRPIKRHMQSKVFNFKNNIQRRGDLLTLRMQFTPSLTSDAGANYSECTGSPQRCGRGAT